MTTIVFYEKPGCGGNARQRAMLQAAGHELDRRDLLTTRWTRASLLRFLAPLPVAQWFNRAAPRVKQGLVTPESLGADEALALLLDDPLLIRRPLMARPDGATLVGFDLAAVQAFVGLAPESVSTGSLEGCAAGSEAKPCPAPRQRHFLTYRGVGLPLQLVEELSSEALHHRNTWFRATYDALGRPTRIEKLVYGDVELQHDYAWDDGRLAQATIRHGDDEPRMMTF